MDQVKELLKGKKTYIVAALGGVMAACSLAGIELPGVDAANLSSGDAVVASLVALIGATLRAGLAADK